MQRAFRMQEQIIRDAAARHSGYAYKMTGDAFQIAFATAHNALDAAIDAQRALHSAWGKSKPFLSTSSKSNDAGIIPTVISANQDLANASPLRVRMALHTGVTEERGDDYLGPVLNRAARLMAAGYGGQILLSLATEELVRDHLPANVALRDLGEHRLKDLTRPEHIFQLIAPDLPTNFPLLKTLHTLPNNLPIQLTSFIGREKEIEETKRLLAMTRLLTLTGVGGTGKTRLSLQVAADVLDEFKDGVWLVELAALVDPTLVPQTVASVLGLHGEEARPLMEMLLDYLRAKNLLLILDNCEHLIDACAKISDVLLHACPRLKILTTSREALGIAGETTFRVPSLTLPDAKRLPPLDTLAQYEAVRLFIDRALAVQSNFQVNNANAPAVAQICSRLDGIPLAIELAASHVKHSTVGQINDHLDNRFRLLTGGSRTALPRQQTLRATIDWSHALLSERQRILFRRLAVFAGGWTFEAAEKVCAEDGVDASELLDLLGHLVDKSLVVLDEQSDETRYRMSETIRQYAREKLLESDESGRVRQRHLESFVQFAEEVASNPGDADQLQWYNRMEIDHDNMRAALGWALEHNDVDLALRLGIALAWFWIARGYLSEGRQWLEKIIESSRHVADPEKISSEYRALFARALSEAGRLAYFQGDYVIARSWAEEALALGRELGDKQSISLSLFCLGQVAMNQGDHVAARALFEERFAFARERSIRQGMSSSLTNLGRIALIERDYKSARALFEESLAISRERGDKRHMLPNLGNLGHIALNDGDYASARALYCECLEFLRQVGLAPRRGVAQCLVGLAGIARANGQMARAARLSGAVEGILEQSGAHLDMIEGIEHERTVTAARTQLDEATFNQLWSEGCAMRLEEAVEYAMEETK